jgi:hypothetical protein
MIETKGRTVNQDGRCRDEEWQHREDEVEILPGSIKFKHPEDLTQVCDSGQKFPELQVVSKFWNPAVLDSEVLPSIFCISNLSYCLRQSISYA